MLMHHCSHTGCRKLIPQSEKYCDEHKGDEKEFWTSKIQNYRSPWAKLYNTKEWRALRNTYIKEHQTCELCGEAKATEVHHIIPFGKAETEEEARALCFDADNLQALCHECHQKFTIKSMSNRCKEK